MPMYKTCETSRASIDPELRRKAYSEAIHLATERVDFVPLFSDVRYVAFSKQLNFQGFPDDVPRSIVDLEIGMAPALCRDRQQTSTRRPILRMLSGIVVAHFAMQSGNAVNDSPTGYWGSG